MTGGNEIETLISICGERHIMKRAVLLLACALGLSACGMFHHPPHQLTKPAQWEPLGYHDHLSSSDN